MASSLSPQCTPLKHAYDSCFNAWFEGYLEPAVAASSNPEQRSAFSKQKAAEFERSCGKIWEQYRDCVQVRSNLFIDPCGYSRHGIHPYGVFDDFCIECGEGERVGQVVTAGKGRKSIEAVVVAYTRNQAVTIFYVKLCLASLHRSSSLESIVNTRNCLDHNKRLWRRSGPL
jgi:Uncharacterised protein family (UPF0203)